MADKYTDAKQAYDEIDEMCKRNKLDAQEALRRGDDGAYRRLTAEGKELEKQRDAARRTYREAIVAKIEGDDGVTSPVDKKDEAPVTPKSGADNSDSTASSTNNTNTTDSSNTGGNATGQPAQNNHYIQYYGHDVHKNGAIPFAGKPPAEEPDKPGIGQKVKGAVNKLGKGFYDALANADSATFKRDVNAKLRGQMTGNIPDVRAETSQQAARLYENDAANRYMEAQREQQEGERNPFHEAGKIAVSQQHAQNKQQINSSGFAGGTAQARLRTTVAPDVQAQKDFGARARQLASQYREKGDMRTRDANEEYGESKEWRVHSRDFNNDLDESARLSKGEGANTEGEDKKPAENTDTSQPAAEPTPESFNTNWQHVVNYLTYGNDPSSGWSSDQKDGGAARKFVEYKNKQSGGGWTPLTAEEVKSVRGGFNGDTGALQTVLEQARPAFSKEWRSGAASRFKDGRQINAGNGHTVQEFEQDNVQSDSRMKNIQGDVSTVMSDLRMKFIKEDFDRYGKLSPEDVAFVLSRMGKKYSHNGRDYDIDDEDEWGDDSDNVLDGYAENIRNYVYSYKPEAQAIDSSIDPNQEHIGPMAQDIEKVNPACIIETPEGVKTVDTGRLAMMNAGAIGDLARRFDELEALVKNGR